MKRSYKIKADLSKGTFDYEENWDNTIFSGTLPLNRLRAYTAYLAEAGIMGTIEF